RRAKPKSRRRLPSNLSSRAITARLSSTSPMPAPPRYLLLAALLALTAIDARAASPHAEAERAIKNGVALRAQGKHAEALEEFKKAYGIAPTPRALAQIGLAEQALGRWLEAEEHVSKAMESASDPWIKSKTGPLKDALETIREHLGDLEIEGPDGADIQ